MKLPTTYRSDSDHAHVIIESPCKSRNKFNYNPEHGLFKLRKVLPAGMHFPCEMGLIPETKGEDGDPLDALLLMDEISYPENEDYKRLKGLNDINKPKLDSIVAFFENYNRSDNKTFKLLG